MGDLQGKSRRWTPMKRGVLALAVGVVLAAGGWVFAQDKPAPAPGPAAPTAAPALDVPEMGIHGYPEIQGPSSIIHGLPGGHGVPVGMGAAAPQRSS